MKNVITFGKLISLLLLFCLPLLLFLSINIHTKKMTRNELSRLAVGTIFLVIINIVSYVVTPHAQCEQCRVIGVGVHIYVHQRV